MFSLNCFCTFVELSQIHLQGLFLGPDSVPSVHVSIPPPTPHTLGYYCYVLKYGRVICLTHFSHFLLNFFQNCLSFSSSSSPYNFQHSDVVFIKTIMGVLVRIALNLNTSLGKDGHFTMRSISTLDLSIYLDLSYFFHQDFVIFNIKVLYILVRLTPKYISLFRMILIGIIILILYSCIHCYYIEI